MTAILFALSALAAPKAPVGPACLADAQKMVAEAGPAAIGKAWVELATCDAAAAKTAAPEVFGKLISGSGADAAAIKAIQLGLGTLIPPWTSTLQPDERSAFFNFLGEQCTVAEVPAFIAETAKSTGEKFWSDRWYAGLDSCRVSTAVDILKAGLDSQASERSRFNGILQTLARNLGKDAIPMLSERLKAEKDPELAAYFIGAFADAAGVGSASGVNRDAVEAAIAAILAAAPTLPEKSVDAARTTLLALGNEMHSDAMASQRYRSLAQADGSLQYGLYVFKAATCKKGDVRVEVHNGMVTNAGRTWPDQLGARVKPTVDMYKWHLPADCVGDVQIVGSSSPLKDKAAFDAFLTSQDAEINKKHPGVKAKVFPEDPLSL